MTEYEAKLFVEAVVRLRKEATDAQASIAVGIYPTMHYAGELIEHGTRINWHGKLKRAAVDMWDTEGNNPENAPNLWEDISYYLGYRIIPETITATLAFSLGEIGYWPPHGSFYKSKRDGNTFPPSVTPEWWEVVETQLRTFALE